MDEILPRLVQKSDENQGGNKKFVSIMKRSRLRNKFLNTKIDIDRKAYNKQRNYVVSLLRNEKNNFYSNLDTKIIVEHFGKLSNHFCLKR